MKTLTTFFVVASALTLACLPVSISAQDESEWPELDASPMDIASYPQRAAFRNYLGEEGKDMNVKVRVFYSRPKVKGRTVFGELVPYGSEWRLGANEATEVYFAQAVDLGGTAVPAGNYTMHAEVQEDHWVVHFSTQQSIWGSANRDKEQDIAMVRVEAEELSQLMEDFTVTFQRIDDEHCNMVMGWENTQVKLPIGFNPIIYSGSDASPVDRVQYPRQSSFHNYLKPEELEGMDARIQVTYGRPQKKGREIFGGLLKYGEVWRVGANESTEIVLFQDVKMGGEMVDAGHYALYAEVNEDYWDIILSTDLPAWGNANRDEAKDAYRIRVTVSTESEALEALTMIFRESDDQKVALVIGWDTTRASLPIEFE